MTPADALKTLVNISFDPITDRTQRDFTVNGFGAIKGLAPIDPGTEITVEGYVTHVKCIVLFRKVLNRPVMSVADIVRV